MPSLSEKLVLDIYYVRNLHNISVVINDTDYGNVDKTTITNVKHILRGYEDIVGKLKRVGAKIEIIED